MIAIFHLPLYNSLQQFVPYLVIVLIGSHWSALIGSSRVHLDVAHRNTFIELHRILYHCFRFKSELLVRPWPTEGFIKII